MFPNKELGFKTFRRKNPRRQPVEDRLLHWKEFESLRSPEQLRKQGYRCMNCGIPFCHQGCPLGNVIPDFNDAVKDDQWEEASEILHSTNNFPEITGRICPAPCEASCVLTINEPAVSIKQIERAIADRAIVDGTIVPEPPESRTGKSVAVVGSGPAGLAAAQQLNRAGHQVTLYERDDVPGGLLVYGIPDFKMEKEMVARRVEQMKAEGVAFECGVEIGKTLPAKELVEMHDAVLLTIGSTKSRDLDIPGRDLDGVHFAMEFLPQQNRRCAGKEIEGKELNAEGKRVIVLGGGDTGSDCHGTSLRQGATHVTSIELLPKPPQEHNPDSLWPNWPMILRTSSSHEEGGERDWSVMTKEFVGENGKLTGLNMVRLEWTPGDDGRLQLQEIPGSEFTLEADMAFLALGFLHPEDTIARELGLELDARGNIKADYDGPDGYATSKESVWAAGDARRGQSLVVWAIHEGREAARAIDTALTGNSELDARDAYGYSEL